MADTKRSREEQARHETKRQRERAVEEALDRANETEPPREGGADLVGDLLDADEPPAELPDCHRRGCAEPAAFVVLERYQEDTGHGAVEATAALCGAHTAEERPANLDGAYEAYVFSVRPIPGSTESD